MNTLRIFISSPSDVREERTVAGRVIERLQGKYWSFVRLDDVFWENRVARATAHFQDELLNPGQCDMVLGILWTRLGSPLPEKFRKLTGEAHATGTEWELAQAFEAYDASLAHTGDPLIAKPDVIVYRRTEERTGDPSDGERRQQREALTAFLDREFFNQDAHHTIKRALTSYATLDEFETRLAGDLEQLILRRIPTLKPGFEPPPISGPPFKDLAHFDFEDSDRFFGRNRAIREVQQRFIERASEGMPFVLIYGGSGYGKSSLMRAGIAPVLTRPGGAIEGMDRWRRVLVQPGQGSGPLCERLARALLAPPTPDDIEQQRGHEHWPLPGLPEMSQTTIDPADTGERWDAASLAQLLAEETKVIYAAAGVARTLDRLGHSMLLQIDQLEEVFTSESVTAAERDAFFRALGALIRTRRVWTVATMRSEYFPRIAETPSLAALVGKSGGYILAPPAPQELREIIRFPALAARLDYERAISPREIAGALTTAEHLDEQILADAADSPDALPLIEFTLHKLHAALLTPNGHRTGDLLRWDTYTTLGGLKGAIARTAEETFSALSPHVQGACDTLFANLVRVDAGSRDVVTRKRTPLADLRAAVPGAGEFLDAFLAARLLVTDEESGDAVATLAHEALITHWPRLAEWIARHRAILRSRQRLEENARQWIESGHSRKLLLAEGRLAEAEEVERSPLFQLGGDERALIAQSRRQARKRLRLFQGAAALFALLAVAAGIAGWLAVNAKRDVERASVVIVEKNRAVESANKTILERSKEITKQNETNLKNLHEASMADYAIAAQRIEKDGKWHEGVAHLARALKWEPTNPLAAGRLYATLSLYAPEKQTWPRALLAHESRVSSAQFNADGTRIVTVSDDDTARVWDLATGNLVSELHAGVVNSAEFSADGSRIVTAWKHLGGERGEAWIWDAATGKPVGEPLRHEVSVVDVQFSPDGSQVVTASYDKTARVWDAATGKPVGRPLPHGNTVFSAKISPDGSRIVTGSSDGTARVWDVATSKPAGPPLRHEGGVVSAQFSADGSRVITVGFAYDQTARVWNAAMGKPIGEPLRHEGDVASAQFSPDGSRIVTSSENIARLWDAATGKPIEEPWRHEGGVHSAKFSPDGSRIVTARDDKTARVWDAATGKPVGEPLRHEGAVSAQFSADGSRIITASGETGGERSKFRVWDAATGKVAGEPLRHRNRVTLNRVASAQFSADGTRIVTASNDTTAQTWDAATSKPIGGPLRHGGAVNSAQFSADGSVIVTACDDETAQMWDVATGKPIGGPLRHEDCVQSAQLSADGKRIVTAWRSLTGDKGGARVWDAATGKPLGKPLGHEGGVTSAAFSPDGSRIVTACDDKAARIWDAATGKPIGEPLRHEDIVWSAQFSADGSRIVTACEDKAARVWDAATGMPIGEPLRHEDKVVSAQFSPDGSRVVTASQDKTARVWDAATSKPIGEPLRHEGIVNSAQFSADGTRVVTAGDDGTARVWNIAKIMRPPVPVPEWVLDRARAIAGLEFDADGQMKPIPDEERRAALLEPSPGNDDWTKLARWLIQPAIERTLTPDSRFTCRQVAERERDSGTMEGLESALRYNPSVPLAHVLLAEFADDPARANFLRDHGFKLLPDDATLWARAAASLVKQKDFPRALKATDKALALDPENARALGERANVYAALGNQKNAGAYFEAALKRDPKEGAALLGRAELRRIQKQWSGALADYDAALAQLPENFGALLGRANVRVVSGDLDAALAAYAEMEGIYPSAPQPLNAHAWLLATCTQDGLRDGARAVDLASRACELTHWQNPDYLDTLSAAYAEKGDFTTALKWQEEAVKLSSNRSPEEQKDLKSRSALYKRKQPYREAVK